MARGVQVYEQATAPIDAQRGDIWIEPGASITVHICVQDQPAGKVFAQMGITITDSDALSAGTGISIIAAEGVVSIANTGVTSVIAGDGIGVDQEDGDVTVSLSDAAILDVQGTENEIGVGVVEQVATVGLPATMVAPGSLTVTTRTGTPLKFACFDANGLLCEGDPVT